MRGILGGRRWDEREGEDGKEEKGRTEEDWVRRMNERMGKEEEEEERGREEGKRRGER